uniref:Uncharacterized protein n=1 Tax=Sphaerodactylus townsendi TaxID=933632 RepID=A0ACB8F2F7_9SAUR
MVASSPGQKGREGRGEGRGGGLPPANLRKEAPEPEPIKAQGEAMLQQELTFLHAAGATSTQPSLIRPLIICGLVGQLFSTIRVFARAVPPPGRDSLPWQQLRGVDCKDRWEIPGSRLAAPNTTGAASVFCLCGKQVLGSWQTCGMVQLSCAVHTLGSQQWLPVLCCINTET